MVTGFEGQLVMVIDRINVFHNERQIQVDTMGKGPSTLVV